MRVNGIRLVSWFCDVCSAGFSVDFLCAMFACGYSGVRVAAFFETLAHFLAFGVAIAYYFRQAFENRSMNVDIYKCACVIFEC